MKGARCIAITTIIWFIIFITCVILYSQVVRVSRIFHIIVMSIPFLITGYVTYATIKKKIKSNTSVCLSIVLSILFCMLFAANFFYIIISDMTTSVHNPNQYQKIMRLYDRNHESLAFFPKEIPQNVKNVRFYEIPQFLQGGSKILLMYQTSDAEIQRYEKQFSEKAKCIYQGEKQISGDPNADVWKFCVCEDEIGVHGLSNDFKCYILDSKSTKPYDWNHGYTYGVAISEEKSQILFYREVW